MPEDRPQRNTLAINKEGRGSGATHAEKSGFPRRIGERDRRAPGRTLC